MEPDPEPARPTTEDIPMHRLLSRLALAATVVATLAGLLPSVSAQPVAARQERIKSMGQLRVCIWPEYYGITWRDPKTQQLSGLDIEMARELARDLKVQPRFVDSSFARLIDDIGSGRCDIAMFAIGITPARAERLRFARPHLQSDIYAITTKANRTIRQWDDIDRPGVVVAVAKGTYHEPVMRAKLRAATLKVVEAPSSREQEVESGRADLFMTDYPFSRRMLDTVDWARLISPDGSFHLTPYAYAIAPGDERFFLRVEQFVADIKRDGRLAAAAARYRLEPIVVTR